MTLSREAQALLVDIWWGEPMRFVAIPRGAEAAYLELSRAGLLASFSTGGTGRCGIRLTDYGREVAFDLSQVYPSMYGWGGVDFDV